MKFDQLKLEDIEFGEFKRGINLTIKGEPIQLQLPRLSVPFGLSGFPSQFGPTKYSIDTSLRGWNSEKSRVKTFYEFLQKIEEYIIQYVISSGLVPGGENEVRSCFNSNLKISGTYDPKFRIKVDNKTKFFSHTDEDITPEELSADLFKGMSCTSIVELKGIYFFQKKVGLTWVMLESKMFESTRVHGPKFIDQECEPDEGSQKISGCLF
jgi:hypothetical protein